MRGMARQGAQPLFLMCPHSLSEIRGAARRATRTSLRTSGFICGRLPYGAGPRFSWPPVKHETASVSQAPGGRLLLAARRSPGAARVRALRGTPAGAASDPTRMTPHESAPRWTERIGLYSLIGLKSIEPSLLPTPIATRGRCACRANGEQCLCGNRCRSSDP